MNTGVFGDIRLKSRATACFSMSLNIQQFFFLVFFRGHGPKFVWMERGKSNRFIFFRRRESIQNARVNSGERKKERKRERASSRNSRVG